MSMQRIVSLAPSNTEIVFALGKGDRLVGVTEFCNYPAEAKLIEKIGGFSTPDIGKIISLSPDLVLATEFHSGEAVPELKKKGIPVYVVKAKTILDASLAISCVGKIIGCPKEAERLANEIQKKIERIRWRSNISEERPGVCYICSHNPLCVARRFCTVNRLIEIAGGVNVMQEVPLGDVGNLCQAIIRISPEIIITSKGHRETTDLFSYVMADPIFRRTRAWLNKRVYQIDSELLCRPGPRAAIGLEIWLNLFILRGVNVNEETYIFTSSVNSQLRLELL